MCSQLLIACTVLCVLELANIVVCLVLFSLSLGQLWYDVAVSLTLLVAFVLLFDNKRVRDRLTLRYIKQYATDKQRRDEEARDEHDDNNGSWTAEASSGGGRRHSAVVVRDGRRRSSGMRERSLSVDDEERRRRGAAERDREVDGGTEKHKAVSILDILQPSKNDGSEASLSPA